MSAAGRSGPRAIAVLGDHGSDRVAAFLAGHVRSLGGLDAEMVLVPRSTDLTAQLTELPPRFHAAYLVEADPLQAHAVADRAAQRDLRMVVSDHDGAAAALCAAVLLHLRDTARPLQRASVAVASAARLPALAPLLMIAGVHDLRMWTEADAAVLPWARVAADADVAIDLRPGPEAAAEALRAAADRADGSLLRPADARWDQHVVAALLRVALACPPGSVHVSTGVLHACVSGIVAATPRPGHGRPAGSAIIDGVEAAVRGAIDPRLAASRVGEDAEEV
jgi:hypothetical protein